MIALDTAMRQGEVLAIRKEHIDFKRNMIHIPISKTGKREQPITETLAKYLRTLLSMLPADCPWLFSAPNSRSGHVTTVRKPFVRVIRAITAAGLDPAKVVRHTFRHTVITQLVQAKVDLPTVMRISGHKTLAMVTRYSHQNEEHLSSAMKALEERILA